MGRTACHRGSRSAGDPAAGPRDGADRLSTQLSRSDGECRRRIPDGWLPTPTWCGMRFRLRMLPTVIPRLVTLCLADRVFWCSRYRRPGRRPAIAHRKREPRSRPMVGTPRRRALERRARAAPLSRAALAALSRTDDSQGAAAARPEPALHRTAVREPRTAWLSRAHRRGARSSRRAATLFRGDWRGAPAGILPAQPRGPGRSERRGPRPGVRRAGSRDVSVPVLTEPHLIAFSPESYWKGEAHRTCDRVPARDAAARRACGGGCRAGDRRLSRCRSVGSPSAHKPTGSLRSRVAEHLAATETAVVRDAVALAQEAIQGTVPDPAAAQSDRPARLRRHVRRALRQDIRALAS